VESQDLRKFVEFDEDSVRRETVYETEHLWAQVLCFDRNQAYGPVSDPASDAVLTIVAGEAVVLVGAGRKRIRQWETALVPAGKELSLVNASADPLVVLLVAAPPPPPAATAAEGAGP
jgi:mannose-6-phosphate isomerase-like protein (cupin superfamily)